MGMCSAADGLSGMRIMRLDFVCDGRMMSDEISCGLREKKERLGFACNLDGHEGQGDRIH